MIESTAEYLSVSIILLFGINIGLAIGHTKLSIKDVLPTIIIYFIFGLLIVTITTFYTEIIYNLINQHISKILGFIGFITILSGIYTLKKWKNNQKDFSELFSLALISSSICCLVGIISTFVLLTPSISFSPFQLMAYILGVLLVIIIIFYSFSKFLKKAKRPYSLILANFMILNGFYFLITTTFIANMESLSLVQMSPLSINSTSSLFFLILAGIGVLLLGVYLQNTLLNNKNNFH